MAGSYKKLTQAKLKVLPVGERLTEHGIVAEKTNDGDIRWKVATMVDGTRIHRVIGRPSEGVTRTQAEQAIEKMRTDARAGRLDLPAGRKTHMSFGEAATAYLDRMERTGGKDLANKRRHIEQQLLPSFVKTRLDSVTPYAIQQYSHDRAKVASQATINRELSTLSHLLNRAVEWGWLRSDRKPSIKKGDEARKKIVVLSDEQAVNLLTAAKNDQDARLYLFVAFGLNAAMRHSEIVAVRYDQIDFDLNRVFIPLAKAGEREQPMTLALTAMLRSQREKEADRDGWVFPSEQGSKVPHRLSMERGFARAVVRAGLDPSKVTPHVMRHTATRSLGVQSRHLVDRVDDEPIWL